MSVDVKTGEKPFKWNVVLDCWSCVHRFLDWDNEHKAHGYRCDILKIKGDDGSILNADLCNYDKCPKKV